jgi:hypothetical protein
MSKTKLTSDDIVFIRNLLRHGSVKWSGRAECLRKARKKVFVRIGLKGQEIFKFHWQCAHCKQWHKDEKEMEVDHIVEIGSFTGDWNVYMEKLFPRPVKKHLQALCVVCHMKKTKAFNAAHIKYQRKK